jgi:hypothetical protein
MDVTPCWSSTTGRSPAIRVPTSLPGAKRRDAEAGGQSDLDSELSRRQDARRAEDGSAARQEWSPGV